MADLIERFMGLDPALRKLPVHQGMAVIAEWARGNITIAQARAAFANLGAEPLSAAAEAEANALVSSVTSIPVTGSATAIADGRARRALRVQEIEQVLNLVDSRVPPYDDPAAVRARLGLP